MSGTGVFAVEFTGLTFPAHWHGDVEIILVTSGHLRVGINLAQRTLSAGEIAVITGGNIHYYTSNLDCRGLLLMFSPTVQKTGTHIFTHPFTARSDIDKIKPLFTGILDELGGMEYGYREHIAAYIQLLSAMLMRHTLDRLDSAAGKTADMANVQRLLEYIESDPGLTLEDASGMLHFSKWHFCRYFKQLTGDTFSKYVSGVRLAAAKEMLVSGGEKITDIAHMCGYATIRTFNRDFKRSVGCTPREFRYSKNM